MDETFALAASSIQSIYTNLPPSLQSHLTSASAYLHRTIPPSLIEQAASLLARTTPEILIATLLPLLILVFSMSWPSRFWPSGRYSPFGAPAGHTPPTVTEDDYHYLGPDDIVDPPRQSSYGFPSQSRNATRIENNSSLSPDILNLRHRGTTYPLHFPAYAIADGGLRVGDLRRIAAKETKAEDPRRVKLLYKGKTLKDDARACREEGLKQNSELMCVVSEASPMEAESSESADEDEMLNGAGGPRIDVDGTVIPQRKRKGHRGGRKKKGSGSSTPREGVPPRDSRFLAPDRTGSGASTSRSNSPMRPSQPPPSKKIQSPSEKLDELSRTFHTVFVPKCVHFTANPPSDSKARDLEYKKLSESLLAQIMLKCDAVETEGDEGLRGRRKELVREVQAMLNNLDWVGKRGY